MAIDGSQLGIYPIEQAQRIADDEGYDLVEIAPQAKPPVCRIMDYGKFKYDQAIKAKQARKNQSKIETKEMKFRPEDRCGRLHHQEEARASLLGGRLQGQDHHHVPRPRNGTPGTGPDHSGAPGRRPEGRCGHRKPAEDGRPQHAHAHRPASRKHGGEEKEGKRQERRRKGRRLMPKMKTHRGTAKRFRVTGSGKIMRAKAYKSHIHDQEELRSVSVISVTRPRWLPPTSRS